MDDIGKIIDLIFADYKGLWGTCADSLIGIDLRAMRSGAHVIQDQALALIRPISKEEVDAAI